MIREVGQGRYGLCPEGSNADAGSLWSGCPGRFRVNYVVVALRAAGRIDASRNNIEAGEMAHPVGNGVIGAGGVAADAESADHLPALIERNAATESDDAAWHEPEARSLRLEGRVKRVRVVQAIERTAGLCRPIEVGR